MNLINYQATVSPFESAPASAVVGEVMITHNSERIGLDSQ